MTEERRKFELYSIVLRYLVYKITENLRKIYLDIDFDLHRMTLTAIYRTSPTDLELELLDDIVTNSNAPIPDFFVEAKTILLNDHDENIKHDFLIFSFFEDYMADW